MNRIMRQSGVNRLLVATVVSGCLWPRFPATVVSRLLLATVPRDTVATVSRLLLATVSRDTVATFCTFYDHPISSMNYE